MIRRVMIAVAVLMMSACGAPKDPEMLDYGDLPDPPITLVRVVQGNEAPPAGATGVVDIPLSESQPIYEIWNDPETRMDPWGTILLENVESDGTVVIRMRNEVLRARPGRAFPGTGIVVVNSDPAMQSALLRSKWVLTVENEAP